MRCLNARVFVALLSVCWVSSSARAAEPVTILPLGDSITRGFGSQNLGGYREFLYQRLASTGSSPDFLGSLASGSFPDPQHEGHDSATIRALTSIYAGPEATGAGKVTLLMVGTNDCWKGTGPDSAANAPSNLNRLIEAILESNSNTQLFVASIPPIWDGHISVEYQSVRDYNAAIPGIVASWAARGKSIRFVDVYNAMTIQDLYDGVHPNDSGYQKIADAFFNAMVTVPEPGSAALIGVGTSLALLRRRR